MSKPYGFVKCHVISESKLQSSRHGQEIQYHLHVTLAVAAGAGGGHAQHWDTAINVGTNDADDLLNYRLVYDYHHPLITKLKAAAPGFHSLTGTTGLPALDFLRSDMLAETGHWRESDVMDGTAHVEPAATLARLLHRAHAQQLDVYVFGRTYETGGPGIHDVHMNQGSQTAKFLNNGVDDRNDHNDVWQDGAVLVDLKEPEWAAYFTAFTQQLVPTDHLGNPAPAAHPIDDGDEGSLAKS